MEQEKILGMESFNQYKIWTENLLDGLKKIEGEIEKINTPEELMSVIGFGYEQYARILNEVFKGRVGEMSMDLENIIKEFNPDIKIDYRDIPYELIEKIEKFRSSKDKTDLPTKEDVTMAISNIKNLLKSFN